MPPNKGECQSTINAKKAIKIRSNKKIKFYEKACDGVLLSNRTWSCCLQVNFPLKYLFLLQVTVPRSKCNLSNWIAFYLNEKKSNKANINFKFKKDKNKNSNARGSFVDVCFSKQTVCKKSGHKSIANQTVGYLKLEK